MRRRHRSSAIQASKKIKKQLSVKSKSIIEKQNSLKIIKKPKTALASKSKKDQKLKIKRENRHQHINEQSISTTNVPTNNSSIISQPHQDPNSNQLSHCPIITLANDHHLTIKVSSKKEKNSVFNTSLEETRGFEGIHDSMSSEIHNKMKNDPKLESESNQKLGRTLINAEYAGTTITPQPSAELENSNISNVCIPLIPFITPSPQVFLSEQTHQITKFNYGTSDRVKREDNYDSRSENSGNSGDFILVDDPREGSSLSTSTSDQVLDILTCHRTDKPHLQLINAEEIQSKVGTSQNILLDVLMELSHVNEETKVIEKKDHRRDNKRVQGSVVHDTTREIRSRENAIIVCKKEACDPQIDPAPLCPSDKATSDTEEMLKLALVSPSSNGEAQEQVQNGTNVSDVQLDLAVRTSISAPTRSSISISSSVDGGNKCINSPGAVYDELEPENKQTDQLISQQDMPTDQSTKPHSSLIKLLETPSAIQTSLCTSSMQATVIPTSIANTTTTTAVIEQLESSEPLLEASQITIPQHQERIRQGQMLNFTPTPTQFTSTTNIYSEPIKTASMWNSNEASAHPSSHAVTRIDNNFGSVIRNPQSAILPLPHAIVNNRITVAQHNQQIIYPQMQMHQPSQNNHYPVSFCHPQSNSNSNILAMPTNGDYYGKLPQATFIKPTKLPLPTNRVFDHPAINHIQNLSTYPTLQPNTHHTSSSMPIFPLQLNQFSQQVNITPPPPYQTFSSDQISSLGIKSIQIPQLDQTNFQHGKLSQHRTLPCEPLQQTSMHFYQQPQQLPYQQLVFQPGTTYRKESIEMPPEFISAPSTSIAPSTFSTINNPMIGQKQNIVDQLLAGPGPFSRIIRDVLSQNPTVQSQMEQTSKWPTQVSPNLQQTSQSPMPQLKFALTQQGSLPHASIPPVVSDSLAATSSTYTINKNHHNRLLGTMAHCQTQPNNQSSSQFGDASLTASVAVSPGNCSRSAADPALIPTSQLLSSLSDKDLENLRRSLLVLLHENQQKHQDLPTNLFKHDPDKS